MGATDLSSNVPDQPGGVVTPLKVARKSPHKPKEGDWTEEVWNAVHADYRTGTTYGKLSETYSIPVDLIVYRKRRESWTRDLRADVQLETFARLAVGSESADSPVGDDETVIAAAAQRGAAVVRRHRAALAAHIEALSVLSGLLKEAADAVQAGSPIPERAAMILPKHSPGALSFVAQQVSNAYARAVPLERRAYGLDEGGDEVPYEDRMRTWYAQRAAERHAERERRVAGGG